MQNEEKQFVFVCMYRKTEHLNKTHTPNRLISPWEKM